jgi:hypothetical protein
MIHCWFVIVDGKLKNIAAKISNQQSINNLKRARSETVMSSQAREEALSHCVAFLASSRR